MANGKPTVEPLRLRFKKRMKGSRGELTLLSREHATVLARRIALLSVQMVMKLEYNDVDSYTVENNLMAIQGYISRLRRMRYALAKHKALEMLARERTIK